MAKRAEAVTVIGGADGPTSVFLVGRTKGKKRLKDRIRTYFYRKKKSRVERRITANSHTLQEVADYIKNKYRGMEVLEEKRWSAEEKSSLKMSLLMEHCPELLGDFAVVDKPKDHTPKALKEFVDRMELRQKAAENISEDVFPLDFHAFEIKYPDGTIQIILEGVWGYLGVSRSGSKKMMRKSKAVVKDLYCYYGVTKSDIRSRSKRYQALTAVLCE